MAGDDGWHRTPDAGGSLGQGRHLRPPRLPGLALAVAPLPVAREPRAALHGRPGALAALALVWAWRLSGKARTFAVCGGALLLAYFVTGSVYFFWYMAFPICAAMLCLASIPNRLVYLVAIVVAASSWTTNYPLRRWTTQYRSLIRVAMQLPEHGTVMMDAIGVAGLAAS